MAYPGSVATFSEYVPEPIGNDPTKISYVKLFEDAPALSCFALQESTAIPINAILNKPMENRKKPYIDGITLEEGKKGDVVRAATHHGVKYNVEFMLPFAPDYYLGLDCTLKGVPPHINEGARWQIRVARWVSAYEFIFDPSPEPVDLIATFYPVDSRSNVMLGERFYPNVPFRYGEDLKARHMTSKSIEPPFVNGVTLTDGYKDTVIPCALTASEVYKTGKPFDKLGIYFLGQDGELTRKVPRFEDGDRWYCPVLEVINPLYFTLLNRSPIRLADGTKVNSDEPDPETQP